MQLYLKYESGHYFFPVEERFHVDFEQIREDLVVFGVAPWENCLPEPEYDDGPFKRICGDGISDRKRNEAP